MFLLENSVETRALIGKYIEVYEYPTGAIEIRTNGRALPYATYDRLAIVEQGSIVENKRLGHVLQIAQRTGTEGQPSWPVCSSPHESRAPICSVGPRTRNKSATEINDRGSQSRNPESSALTLLVAERIYSMSRTSRRARSIPLLASSSSFNVFLIWY